MSKTDEIVNIIESYLIGTGDDYIKKGKALLSNKVNFFIANKEAIKLVLPGFPCKSPNQADKTFSEMPDYGEVQSIDLLQALCDRILAIYSYGAELTIVSDGTTFSDLVGVKNSVMQEYNTRLRKLTITKNIKWVGLVELCDLEGKKKDYSSELLRQQLVEKGAKKNNTLDNYIKKVRQKPELSKKHDLLCGYLYNDVSIAPFLPNDRDHYFSTIAQSAYEMMFRGEALTRAINRTFANHIRLSTHKYDNSGPKFTVRLSNNDQQVLVPWHCVPVMRLDGNIALMSHAAAEKLAISLAFSEGDHWMYIEVPSAELSQLKFEVIKRPRFGIKVTLGESIELTKIPPAFLAMLSHTFGFCLLPNTAFNDEQDLLNMSKKFGAVFEWQFGAVHVIKPKEKPDGLVHSLEKTPLHWDLNMLPLDHEKVAGNKHFSAAMFFLYCKTPSLQGEGQTTIVDSRNVLKLAGQKKLTKWQKTELTYFTKMTYFGGAPRTYPLVLNHPITDEPVLRYQEGSDLDLQTLDIGSDTLNESALKALIEEVNTLCYDPRCMVAHDWQAEDLLIIDNHYTLHGRLPMSAHSMKRELWRVQII